MTLNAMKTSSSARVPMYSRLHPVIPQLYVPEWETDMKNRNLIVKNAEQGGIPHHEHDENLFLDKREQMSYNVENRTRVESKYQLPPREQMLRPEFHHATSRYQSSLMYMKDSQ